MAQETSAVQQAKEEDYRSFFGTLHPLMAIRAVAWWRVLIIVAYAFFVAVSTIFYNVLGIHVRHLTHYYHTVQPNMTQDQLDLIIHKSLVCYWMSVAFTLVLMLVMLGHIYMALDVGARRYGGWPWLYLAAGYLVMEAILIWSVGGKLGYPWAVLRFFGYWADCWCVLVLWRFGRYTVALEKKEEAAEWAKMTKAADAIFGLVSKAPSPPPSYYV